MDLIKTEINVYMLYALGVCLCPIWILRALTMKTMLTHSLFLLYSERARSHKRWNWHVQIVHTGMMCYTIHFIFTSVFVRPLAATFIGIELFLWHVRRTTNCLECRAKNAKKTRNINSTANNNNNDQLLALASVSLFVCFMAATDCITISYSILGIVLEITQVLRTLSLSQSDSQTVSQSECGVYTAFE